jgi:hypothetical protein
MKTTLLSILLIQTIVASSAFCKEDSLDNARSAKLKQVVTALATADADALQSVLSGEHQTISKEEASSLLKTITTSWGDLKMLEEINEAELQTTFNKGDMHVIAHWGKLPTQYGKWMLFRTPNRENYYLRIGLLFGKGSEHAGQFVACEFPAPKKTTPNKPDAGDGK